MKYLALVLALALDYSAACALLSETPTPFYITCKMPGEKSENINGEEMLGGGGSPLISNGEEDMGSNEVSRASSSSSPSLAAKTKKVRNTKCLQGPRPIAKHVKIRTDRCKRIRKFLGRQRSVTGLPIANVLSQSMSRREVIKTQV